MKRVIITGATGMIGATLAKLLAEYDIEVTAIVRPDTPKLKNIKQIGSVKIVSCDMQNYPSLCEALYPPYDTWFHFAWDGTYGDSRNNTIQQTKNICNTLSAVETAYRLGCNTFIGAGSQAEFGNVDGVISNKQPQNPTTAYGIAKYCAGKLSRVECSKRHMKHCWGRIVSTYGPMDNDYTMIMSSVKGMLQGKRMQFTEGNQLWDYLYSEDCARAFYLLGEKGINGKSYIIASGKSRTLKEYILAMRDTINPQLSIGLGELPYYPDQVMHLSADISELQNDTGFSAQVDFEDVIREIVKWAKK